MLVPVVRPQDPDDRHTRLGIGAGSWSGLDREFAGSPGGIV